MGIAIDAIRDAVRGFILKEFLPGEDPDELTDATLLISGGILDSLATIKLISFLEDKYQIAVKPHEADADNLNTVADIVRLVSSKL
jgi:acyl carrier protein